MEADNTDAASAWTLLRRPRKGNMAAACHNSRKKKPVSLLLLLLLPSSPSSTCHPPPPPPSPGCQPPVRDEIRLHMEPRASSAAYTKTTTSLCEWRRRHFHVSVSGAGGGGGGGVRGGEGGSGGGGGWESDVAACRWMTSPQTLPFCFWPRNLTVSVSNTGKSVF